MTSPIKSLLCIYPVTFSCKLEKKHIYQLTNFLLHTVAIAPSNRTIWIKIVVRYRICSYPSILIIYNHLHTVTPIVIHISFCPINGTAIRFKVWIVPYDSKKSTWLWLRNYQVKVEKILKGSLDSIPSPSVKIQTMSGKVCLSCKGKTLLGNKSLLTSPNNVLPQVNFPANNLNFHWRQRWWDRIQAIFLNLFYFTYSSK